MTCAAGISWAVPGQPPISGFILELFSSLSCPPLPISHSQSLTYIFLIILLPALSGSPSPAITPDNCELSGGHRQQSGRQHLRCCPSTGESVASVDISLSFSPSLPQVPQADPVPQLLGKAGKLAGL